MRALERALRRTLAAAPDRAPRAIASPNRRLKIGYVSPDFREHCQSLFTMPLLAHHDHAAFEIFCYSSVERPDEYTRRIAGYADVWRDVRPLDDAALCEIIREDRIDVLVDLTMHMAGGRPLVFARKPAPIQIAWLAYPGTTGIGAIEYRLSDPRLDPDGFDESLQRAHAASARFILVLRPADRSARSQSTARDRARLPDPRVLEQPLQIDR